MGITWALRGFLKCCNTHVYTILGYRQVVLNSDTTCMGGVTPCFCGVTLAWGVAVRPVPPAQERLARTHLAAEA